MDWRQRTDFWYGTLLLRPLEGLKTAEFGGAYVSIAVVDANIGQAIRRIFSAVENEGWQVTSIPTMKRAWDYLGEEDEDGIIDQNPEWLGLVERAERDGLALGSIHAFRIDRRNLTWK